MGDEFWDGLKFMEVYDVFYHALATVKLHHGTPVFVSELDHARFALKRGAIELQAWRSEIKLSQDTWGTRQAQRLLALRIATLLEAMC